MRCTSVVGVILATCLFVFCGVVRADWVTTTVLAQANPQAEAVNPVTGKIYVADSGSASVTVIDGTTYGTATVAVGTAPSALAVNPVTNKIYVANNDSAGSVTVIDGTTNRTTLVAAGSSPHSGDTSRRRRLGARTPRRSLRRRRPGNRGGNRPRRPPLHGSPSPRGRRAQPPLRRRPVRKPRNLRLPELGSTLRN